MPFSVRSVGTAGNSIAIRVPRREANAVGLAAGQQVIISVERGALVVRPFTQEMLALVTGEGGAVEPARKGRK